MEQNPITESIKHLQHCGWKKTEAVNLIKALHSDDAEKLWEFAPEWIEMVGKAKMEIAMFEIIAKGVVTVTKRDGEWFYGLNDIGFEVGNQIFGEQNGSK